MLFLSCQRCKTFSFTKFNFVTVLTRAAPEIYVADIERAENGFGGAITLLGIKLVFNLSPIPSEAFSRNLIKTND